MNATRCVWILSIIICVARGHVGNDIGQNQKEQDTSADNSTESLSLVTAANREFAFRLYRSLAANPDSQGKNIFFSPVSGLSPWPLWRLERVEKPTDSFSETKKANEVTSEGTAVFMDNLFKPQPEFLDTLKKPYFADGFNVDFTKSSESANTINKKMGNSVPDLTKEDLFMVDEKTKVVHQATLDVDEAGATAAAATGIAITLHSYCYVPVLKFNHHYTKTTHLSPTADFFPESDLPPHSLTLPPSITL
ncbi:hypothetical protein D4764_0132000 [Takifugu flavidus]|uniref:Uncharacterized protein n=1 Tax=Takifugu flavidus TaxID=433684 RepID=A0A5C6MMK0_9TELE|nr:hypothetical protein D4764_0132000 [Takifugu flavidus]